MTRKRRSKSTLQMNAEGMFWIGLAATVVLTLTGVCVGVPEAVAPFLLASFALTIVGGAIMYWSARRQGDEE